MQHRNLTLLACCPEPPPPGRAQASLESRAEHKQGGKKKNKEKKIKEDKIKKNTMKKKRSIALQGSMA